MKKAYLLAFVFLAIAVVNGQVKKITRVGLFTSLYLDSAFDASGKYRLQNSFPRQAISGLEFYEGAVMAMDSINHFSIQAKMEVFDIQSKTGAIPLQLSNKKFDSLDLMIAQVGGSEYLQLSQIAKEKNIPMVSATYPNDGGIRESPMVFIANPKINSHLQVIHNQVFKKWPEANILFFKRQDPADDRIEAQFKEFNAATPFKNKYKTAILGADFTVNDLVPLLDTSKMNVLMLGSLDNDFAIQFVKAVAAYPKKGIIQVVGMPGWDGIKELQGKNYAGIPIHYSTGFYVPAGHKWAGNMDEKIKSTTGVKPSLSFYRGFELTFYFVNILSTQGSIDEIGLRATQYKVLSDFDFRAVKWAQSSALADYYENKRIHFVRRLNGVNTIQ